MVFFAVFHWSLLRLAIGSLRSFSLVPLAVPHWLVPGFPTVPFAVFHWPHLQFPIGHSSAAPCFLLRFSSCLLCAFQLVSSATFHWSPPRSSDSHRRGLKLVPVAVLRWLVPIAVSQRTPLWSSMGLLCGFSLVPFAVFIGPHCGFTQAALAVCHRFPSRFSIGPLWGFPLVTFAISHRSP